jgi:uncharacterized membrane protein
MDARIVRAAGLAALMAAPIATHVSLATGQAPGLVGGLLVVQAGAIGWMLVAGLRRVLLRWALWGAGMLGVLGLWLGVRDNVVALSALPHAMANGGLLALFAASLAPGREAMISRFARHVRGTLSPAILLYTRRVTWAWCGFFAGQILVSLGLFLFAPVAVWSIFVNLLNLPLLVAMFAAEYLVRRVYHPYPPAQRAGAFGRMLGAFRAATRAGG